MNFISSQHLHRDNPRCGAALFFDDTLQMFDKLSDEEIALIWETHPNWRLPHGCRERNKRHAEAVDLVVGIADRELAGRGRA